MATKGKETSGSTRRRQGVVLSYANAVVSLIVGLLYVPIMLRGIGQDEYGLYQLIGSMLGYMSIVNGVLSAGTTRFYCLAHASGDRERMHGVLSTCRLMFRGAVCAVFAGTAVAVLLFPAVYGNSLSGGQVLECQIMLTVVALNLAVTMTNSVYVAVINANERFFFLKATALANSVAQPAAIVCAIRFFPYATTIVLVMLSMNVIVAAVQNRYARGILGSRIMPAPLDRPLMRSIAGFTAILLVASVADCIFWRTNQLILGYYFGAATVAVYGVGYQIYSAYLSLGNVITSVFMPRISALVESRQTDEISRLFVKVGRLSLYVLLLIYGGFFVLGEDFILLWAGEGYSDAYYVALAVMTAFVLDSSQSLGITILQVMGKYRFRALLYFASACVSVVAAFLVAPRGGAIGCALVSAVAMAVVNGPVMNVYYHRVVHLDIPAFWRSAARVAAAPAAVTVLFKFLWGAVPIAHGWPALVAAGVLFACAFALAAWAFSFDGYERGLVLGALGKARSLFSRKAGD